MHINDKKNFAEIGNIFKIDKSVVRRIIKRFQHRGTVSPAKKSGRPKKTTAHQDHLLKRISTSNPQLTANQVKKAADVVTVHDRTIRRRLNNFGLFGRRPAKKPLISVKNRKRRLQFARDHLNWSTDQWKKVLWSDESKFNLFSSDGIRYIRRPINRRFDPRYTVPTVKHGGGSIMVWGCFSGNGIGPIHKIDGIMDRFGYRDIMANVMLPFFRTHMPRGSLFQQDNDPKHSSKLVDQWFKQKKVKKMDWPAQSPDLNPIENLWDEVERRIRHRTYSNSNDLWAAIQKSWGIYQFR